jgi:hypothetical protein
MSDESFIIEQIKRFKNMNALFAVSPEAMVPNVCPQSACPGKTVVINYDYSAINEICDDVGAQETIEKCKDGSAKKWKTCVPPGYWVEDEKICELAGCPDYNVAHGETFCKDFDLYRCEDGSHILAETNSKDCGYVEVCTEGETRNKTYCPDGVTKKSWEECVSGKWVAKTQTCPEVECYRNVIIYKGPYPSDPKYIIWTKDVGGSGTEAYDTLEQCKRHIDSTIKLGFTYNQCGEVVECTEGEKRNVVLCPDGEFMKSWEECVSGEWVAKTGVCGCTAGTTSCQGYNLYTCVDGEWVLKEGDSVECGYIENGKIGILDPIISWIEVSFDVDRKTAEMYAYFGIAGIGAAVVLGVMSR